MRRSQKPWESNTHTHTHTRYNLTNKEKTIETIYFEYYYYARDG